MYCRIRTRVHTVGDKKKLERLLLSKLACGLPENILLIILNSKRQDVPMITSTNHFLCFYNKAA